MCTSVREKRTIIEVVFENDEVRNVLEVVEFDGEEALAGGQYRWVERCQVDQRKTRRSLELILDASHLSGQFGLRAFQSHTKYSTRVYDNK